MGCERSTLQTVDEKAFQNPGNAPDKEDEIVFSDIQVDIINSTWPLLAQDLTGHGTAVFLDIFGAEPGIRKLFPYSDMNKENLSKHPGLRGHALKFMQVFNKVCDTLPNLDKESPISERLMVLGAQHAAMPGFDVVYFNIFVKSLHLTWERVLGEEYTDDVRGAWSTLFEFIMERIRDGYILYNQDEPLPYPAKGTH